jgi:hypothetical protein
MLNFLKQKGYIGPIGDDIPSLIPIVVALVIFFSTFSFTLNEFNLRSQSFTADRDTLIIATALKGDSYISAFYEFDNACKGVRVRGLHYVAGLIESKKWNDIALEAQSNPNVPSLGFIGDYFFEANGNSFECVSGLKEDFSAEELSEILLNKQYVILSFPVALELENAIVPATLVVITWRI